MPAMTSFTDTFVRGVYDRIAKEFDNTRYSLWPGVRDFLDSLQTYDKVLDIGCGNGKYLSYRNDLDMYGCDQCSRLLEIAASKHPNAKLVQSDICSMPYESDVFDACICIAVFHHLENVEARKLFLNELDRVMRPGARCLITVWAKEQLEKENTKNWVEIGENDYLVPWGKELWRYYHLFDREEITKLVSTFNAFSIEEVYYEKQNWYIRLYKNIT